MRTCLHIVKSAQPECTGMYRIITALARHAEAHGYRVQTLFLEDGPLRAQLEAAGVAASAVRWNGRKTDMAGALRVARWLHNNPAEIAHVHHGGYVLRTLCRWAGVCAVVQHVHGTVLEPDMSSAAKLRFRGADAVIACSQTVAESLRACAPEVIYSGIETATTMPPGPPVHGPLRLGTLSRLVRLKRIDCVIEATARLRAMGIDVAAEICGTGPEEAALRALAERLGVTREVRFLGWQAQTATLLASWHVLVQPSLTEGFGLSALEAMAAGRAVVASRVEGLAELVVDGVTGRLIPPGDTDALTACLVELARDRDRLTQMGAEGWRRARAEFSAETMAQKITALYDRLLDAE